MSTPGRLGLVLALLTAVAAGQAPGPVADAVPAAARAAVVGATVVCPDVRQVGERGATAGRAGSGTAAGRLGEPAAALAPAPVVRDLAGNEPAGAVVVTAQGPAAGALLAEQSTRATAGNRLGVAALSCPAPGASHWFVGGSTRVGHSAELLLVNVEDAPAVVDVGVWTSDGPADPRPGRGIRVPARGRASVPLERLAPDRDLLAVHVRSARGRVAAALRVVRVDGRIPLGTDWVPATQPAGDVVVPGLPRGPGRRTALITNPGGDDAVVRVELTTDDGRLVPDGMAAVAVPAGTSVQLDLSEALAATPAAMRVVSDGPAVLAGAAIVDRQDGPVREIAYSAGTPALTRPALLADVRLSPPTEVTLLLSALSGDAAVDVVPVAAPGGLPEPRRVEVPSGTTVAVRLSRFLPPRSTGSLAVEVRPVSGPVHAARYARERGVRGPLTTLLPLGPPRTTVSRPAVVADPGAGR
ncbi:MAG: DUF5719 family protein [Mycobacteriales bacterium]